MSSKAKKIVEECAANESIRTLDLVDKGISNIIELSGLCTY